MKRGPRKERRYPIEPLERLFADACVCESRNWLAGEAKGVTVQMLARPNAVVMAEALGLQRGTVSRWRTDGLSVEHADRAACVLGFHPSDLWPSWFGDALKDAAIDRIRVRARRRRNRDAARTAYQTRKNINLPNTKESEAA